MSTDFQNELVFDILTKGKKIKSRKVINAVKKFRKSFGGGISVTCAHLPFCLIEGEMPLLEQYRCMTEKCQDLKCAKMVHEISIHTNEAVSQ